MYQTKWTVHVCNCQKQQPNKKNKQYNNCSLWRWKSLYTSIVRFFLNVRTKLTKPTHTWQPSSFFPYTLFLPIITFPVFSTYSLLSLHLPSSPSYTASSSSSSSLPPLSLLWAIRIHYRLSWFMAQSHIIGEHGGMLINLHTTERHMRTNTHRVTKTTLHAYLSAYQRHG